jgi:hypothetical protein
MDATDFLAGTSVTSVSTDLRGLELGDYIRVFAARNPGRLEPGALNCALAKCAPRSLINASDTAMTQNGAAQHGHL